MVSVTEVPTKLTKKKKKIEKFNGQDLNSIKKNQHRTLLVICGISQIMF